MKITQEEQRQGQEMYQKLIEKAWKDSNFKKQLVESPREAIHIFSEGKIEIQENVSIVVEDQMNSSIIYLNIPKKLDLSNLELSEEQLELIAGGWEKTGNGLWYDIGWNAGLWLCEQMK